MKFGVSSYSFRPLLQRQEITMEGVFDQIVASGGTHLELATLTVGEAAGPMETYELRKDAATRAILDAASRNSGIEISGICIPASFIDEDQTARRAQIDRAKGYIDLCAEMGVGFLRTDVVPWALRPDSYAQVEALFPVIIGACRELADHAKAQGVVLSIENHGFLMNSSERCRRLIHAVDSPNFRMTLDIGNFLCVDEDPLIATRNCLDLASYVHVKDFLWRRHYPGPGWLETMGGRHSVGTVFGFGDGETRASVEAILRSGYDGYVSLEFEGNAPSLMGCDTGLANVIRIFDEVKADIAA